jgi:outer membrane protein TolC
VLQRSEKLQADATSLRATNLYSRAERGIFEPALVGSVEHNENRRQNTARDVVSLGNSLFDERNNSYTSALEFLVPSGARIRVGYSLRDINNNLQFGARTNGEFETFIGGNIVQPLLKNAGAAATRFAIRLADSNADIAKQEYRRALLQLIGGAESAYLGLYLAQEQLRTFEESVRVAETVLADFRIRAETGKASELDVLQAEADLSERNNGRRDAQQKLAEARARTAAFVATTERDLQGVLTAEPPAPVAPERLAFEDRWPTLFDFNPDYVAQRKRIDQEGIRVAFARNQRLPQLDVRASYGMNGLGQTTGESWDAVTSGEFPTWYVGAELRVPLGGDAKSRHELSAARDRQSASVLALKDLETQLANLLATSIHRVRNSHASIADTETTVRLNRTLLDTELARLDVGRIEARRVLEVERDLLIARLTALAAVVLYHQSTIDLEILTGTYLVKRGVESVSGDLPMPASAFRRLQGSRRDFYLKPSGDHEPASVAAGVSPAVEGGVSPPGFPGSRSVSRSISNRWLSMNPAPDPDRPAGRYKALLAGHQSGSPPRPDPARRSAPDPPTRK